MLRIGQKVHLSGDNVEAGIDDVATVDGFELVDEGYVVHLLFPSVSEEGGDDANNGDDISK